MGLAIATLISPGARAQQAAPDSPPNQCFFITQYEHWRAPDANTIYVRVQNHRYYRLGLSQACPALKWPNAYLNVKPRGGETICHASDWILTVSMGKQGINEPCIVKTMTLLTQQQADALPRQARP
jgi:hypothetical protein